MPNQAPAILKSGGTFTGQITGPDGAVGLPTYSFSGDKTTGFLRVYGGIVMTTASSPTHGFNYDGPGQIKITTAGYFSWAASGSTSSLDGVSDLFISRDAANTLGQKNGVNAQAYRIYNTYTDASNYERGGMDWTSLSGQLTIGTVSSGTGIARSLRLLAGGNSVTWSGSAFSPVVISDLGLALTPWKRIYIDSTNTATVGAVTINKAAGRVNMPAGAGSMTVTNSLVTAASHVFLSAGPSGNLVGVSFEITASAGSFIINAVPVVTNQTPIDFFIVNTD